jgi:hypothetical protein
MIKLKNHSSSTSGHIAVVAYAIFETHFVRSTFCTDGKNRKIFMVSKRVYPKVPGLAAWSENCKWYSSLPLGAVVSLFCESI